MSKVSGNDRFERLLHQLLAERRSAKAAPATEKKAAKADLKTGRKTPRDQDGFDTAKANRPEPTAVKSRTDDLQ